MFPQMQTPQDIADAKNASYRRKYDDDVAAYNKAAEGWKYAQTINIQNGLPKQPFTMKLPQLLVVTVDADGHLEEDYAPADLTLVPAMPKVPPPPTNIITHFDSGAAADKKQDSDIAEILATVRRIEARLP